MKNKILTALISFALAVAICLIPSCASLGNDDSVASSQGNGTSLYSTVLTSSESIVSTADELTKTDLLNKKVRDYFAEYFSNDGNYTYKTGLRLGMSAEGEVIRGYYHNNDLKHVKIKAYGEIGRIFWSFYLIDSETIFVIADEQEYSTGLALAEPGDIYVKKECTKAYVILEGEEYEYNFNRMDIADESDTSLEELLDGVISFLDSTDFVDDPTLSLKW